MSNYKYTCTSCGLVRVDEAPRFVKKDGKLEKDCDWCGKKEHDFEMVAEGALILWEEEDEIQSEIQVSDVQDEVDKALA